MEEREKNGIKHKEHKEGYQRKVFTKDMAKDYTILIDQLEQNNIKNMKLLHQVLKEAISEMEKLTDKK